MIGEPIEPRILELFAELFDYPQRDLSEVVAECAALVSPRSPESAASLREFEAFVKATPLEQMQEIYTRIFELNATCHPYVGYHLFGESYKRSIFLLGLKERYAPRGLDCGTELPDHLAVMLRFLAVCDDATQSKEIICEALLPTLEKIVGASQRDELAAQGDEEHGLKRASVYGSVLQALLRTLQTCASTGTRLEAASSINR